jgi:hypothetical protein
LATTPSVRIVPVPAAQPATSSLHLTVYQLSKAVETIEARLRRIETGHASLRRRVVKREIAQ